MKKRIIVSGAAMAALGMSLLLVGCDRTISKDESTTIRSDGSTKSTEKTVTESPDGTVTKKEEVKKTEPVKP